MDEPIENPIIKHLVISGGGTFGLIAYGVLRESHNKGVWNNENIQSIYGTSIGALLGVILALKYDWPTLDDYFIKRPWHHIFKYDINSIFGAFTNRGIFDIKIIEEVLGPLFCGMDLSLNITMREFYEVTKIDVHVFATNINEFQLVDISHKTHPDWKVFEAVYASACLPIFFAPFAKDGQYYVDGGNFLNYPLEPCIQCCENNNEVLGIRKMYIESTNDFIDEGSNLMDYVLVLLNRTLKMITKDSDHIHIENEYVIEAAIVSAMDLIKMASSEDGRRQWIEDGTRIVTQTERETSQDTLGQDRVDKLD